MRFRSEIIMNTAFQLLSRPKIHANDFPFAKPNVPTEITASAITEGRGVAHDNSVKGYANIDDLKTALDISTNHNFNHEATLPRNSIN